MENPMKTYALAALLMPAVLMAAANPAKQAETWVREAHAMARTKGIDALVAEVKSPKGKFMADNPEVDPELTVYDADLKVLAQNRMSRHVGMNHTKLLDASGESYLKKMFTFAKKSDMAWYEYVGPDMSGRPKPYRAYVAFHDEHLIAAVVPK
jgi:hypothetical protein